MPVEFVKAATFSDPAEAEVARARLEGEGIAAVLSGEIGSTTFAGLTGITGNVQLRVPVADLERAVQLLQNSSAAVGTRVRPFWRCPECQAEVDAEIEVCPTCGALAPEAPPEEATLSGEADEGEEEVREQWSPSVADRLAQRAFRAAVIGLFVLPPLGHLYSVYLLFRLRETKSELSAKGQRHRLIALIIDAVVLIPVSLLLFACCVSLAAGPPGFR